MRPRLRVMWQMGAFLVCLATMTCFGFVLHLNLASVSFLYLLLVFAVALRSGFWQASFISLVSVACLDFFFAEPVLHFRIDDPRDWISLMTFESAALVISHLSTKESRSAREAAIHRKSMEQLYELSRCSLLLDLRQPPGEQLVVLIHRIFPVEAVALFDAHLAREYSAGEWHEGEEDVAKQSFLNPFGGGAEGFHSRVLHAGPRTVGALVIRGDVRPLVADALASLSAIAIDRHQSFEKEEQAETTRRSEQLRTAVMDAIAHDFKTPLSSVLTASAGLVEIGHLDAIQSELVSIIEQESTRMNALCTQLLLAVKAEGGKLPITTSEVKVRELIHELASKSRSSAERKRLRMLIEDSKMTVFADRELLAMILGQYLDNALKYSFAGTPIEIAVRKSHNEALFSVRNIGPTIPLEDRERIFDRFYRSPEHAATVSGTGIGLSVVRKAAQAHRGHVWVVSGNSEGTTFFLSIPVEPRRS